MEFDWDPAKDAATEQLRGIRFERGAEIFGGRIVIWTDERRDYGEPRWRALGLSSGEMLHVVFTRRGEVIRIISVRKASRKERARWHSSV